MSDQTQKQKQILASVQAYYAILKPDQQAYFLQYWTPQTLADCFYWMRQWYKAWTGGAARHVQVHRDALQTCMRLDRPKTPIYRGFKLASNHPSLVHCVPGATVLLPVQRNQGHSSWTGDLRVAQRFSGAKRGQLVGVILELLDTHPAIFLAPPERTDRWFNALYDHCLSGAYRRTESEYAIAGEQFTVRVVAVKR